jgi:opacity protein-like surface antigen
MYKYVITIVAMVALAVGSIQAADPAITTSTNDPMVMKIYPDGTKVVVRWSEIGKAVDNGEKHGGSPRIIAYDPGKEGIVPIGQTPSAQPASEPVSSRLPTSSSVVAPESTKSIEATPAPMSDTDNYGPEEGFVLRSAVGASFQQPLSGRSGSGRTYNNFVFQPGIRFDLEPGYNVTDWFRAGLESSFIYNQLHSLSTIDWDTPDNRSVMLYNGSSEIGNGAFYQVPVLANVTFTYPTDGPIRGYLGGGTGAAWDILQVSSGGGGPYTSYHWNFVWEVTAGFTYNVMPGLDLDIAYKLLSTPNPNFDGQGHYQASFNHTAEIGLAYRF